MTLALLLLLTGLVVLLYPVGGDILYRHQSHKIIEGYTQRMEELEEENGWDWLYQLMVAYNENLFAEKQKHLADPFSYQQIDFSLKAFGFEEELIGYLTIPVMEVELPIYMGANAENLRRGAAYLTHTSLPVGGSNTNAVIAAHRGMSTAAMFREIERLEAGDAVLLTNFRETLTYRVTEVQIIAPTDIDRILIQEGRDLITLITCHPYGRNNQRYLVYCEREM